MAPAVLASVGFAIANVVVLGGLAALLARCHAIGIALGCNMSKASGVIRKFVVEFLHAIPQVLWDALFNSIWVCHAQNLTNPVLVVKG